MIYIDNGKTVKIIDTSKRTENAILTLLKTDKDLMMAETHEGYGVDIVEEEPND